MSGMYAITESPQPLRVFLVDDHALVRQGLRSILEREPDMQVVGEASDGHEARKALAHLAPDVVLMDISMPRSDGIEATAALHRTHPTLAVLALTMHEDSSYLKEMLAAGARGYLLKRSGGQEIVRAVRQVAAGAFCLDPLLGTTLVENLVRRSASSRPAAASVLSDREEAVLRRVAQGYANKEIAAQLKIGVKTVETYKTRGMTKLELDGRAALMRYALQNQWLQTR